MNSFSAISGYLCNVLNILVVDIFKVGKSVVVINNSPKNDTPGYHLKQNSNSNSLI